MARYGGLVQVQAGQIPSAQTNFTWVLTEACFLTTAIDGGAQSILNGGGNLRVYTDATKTTQIPIEVVTFVTGGSPSVQVWLLSPSLTAGDTVYVEADTVAISQPPVTDPFGRNAVWVAYILVNHSDSTYDSTGNITPSLTDIVSNPSGKIGSAHSFNGSTSRIDFLLPSNPTDTYTLQAWSNITSNLTGYCIASIADKDATFDQDRLYQGTAGGDDAVIVDNLGGSGVNLSSTASAGTWNHYLYQIKQPETTDAELFINGSSVATQTTATGSLTAFDRVTVGATADSTPVFFFAGLTQEVRLSYLARDADYIQSEYNNQNNPAAFAQMISWEDQDAGGGVIVTPTETSVTTGSFNPTVSLTTIINLLPSVTEPSSESLDPLVVLSAEVVLNVIQVDTILDALDPLVTITSTVNVVPQETIHQVSSLVPTILLSSGVVVSPSTTEQQQEVGDPLVVLTSEVFISPVVSETTSASENPTIVLGTPVIVQPATTQVNLESLDSSITLNAEVFIQPITTEIQATPLDPVVILSVPISITPTTGQQEQDSQNPTVDLLSIVSVSPQTTYSTQESLDPQVTLQFGLSLVPNTVEAVITSLNPNISFGVNVEIESFTIKYASDQVSVSYIDNQVQIKYSS